MRKWQRALGDIRLLGPDGKRFREEVKFLYDYIENLENGLIRAASQLPEDPERALTTLLETYDRS